MLKKLLLSSLFVVASLSSTSISAKQVKQFKQSGVASWYGRQFHGRKTASGEIFNMNSLTAAHRTLPLGTKVLVTNKSNGKSVRVTINDRGPFSGNRIIDLSKAAANQIGMVSSGLATVSVQKCS